MCSSDLEMLSKVQATLEERLGQVIYGYDQDSLEGAVLTGLTKKGWKLAVVEVGLGATLAGALAPLGGPFSGGQVLPALDPEGLSSALADLRGELKAEVGLGVILQTSEGQNHFYALLETPDGREEKERTYGGASISARRWAASVALEWLRRRLS